MKLVKKKDYHFIMMHGQQNIKTVHIIFPTLHNNKNTFVL